MSSPLKIVLLAVNAKYIHSALAPWCIAMAIKTHPSYPADVSVVEGTTNEKPSVVAEKVINEKPDILGVSVYIWNIGYIKKLLPLIRKVMPGTKIVLGGPEVSFNPHEVLSKTREADFIVGGEGEKPFVRLVSFIAEGKEPSLPGISYRKNLGIITSEPYEDGGEFLSAVSDEYIKNLNGRIAYMESQRGCPGRCSFCLSGRCGKLRFLPLDRVFSDVLALAKCGSKTIKFVDRTFNSDNKRAKKIIDFIRENYGKEIPEGVCFHFEIAADTIDEGLISSLKSAPPGAVQLEAGIQSFNEKTLAAINRRANIEKLEKNIAKIMSFANIHLHVDLIAGLPYETMDSFLEGFDRAYKMKPHKLQLGFLKLLHGSSLEKEKDRGVYSEKPPYEVIETPWMTSEELLSLHKMEDAFERVYGTGRFRRTLRYVLSVSGKKTPHFFMYLGEIEGENTGLFEYTKKVYDALSRLENVDKAVLRDMMAWDFIATNPSGSLSPCLKIFDNRLKEAKKLIASLFPKKKGVKRGVFVLSSENSAVFADYTGKSPVTGEYKTKKVSLDFTKEK